MNKFHRLGILLAFGSLISFSPMIFSQDDIASLRDGISIPETNAATPWNKFPVEAENFRLDYEQQPALIPHLIEGYRMDLESNQCMDNCHTIFKQPSVSHYEDRDGNILDEIDSRRYLCTSCHVPQTDAQPLRASLFESVSD